MLSWVDAVKAICMIGVFFMHSQEYYGIGDVNYGYIVAPFYVNAFFFVSGYLLFRKYLSNDMLTKFTGGYRQALLNVFFKLVIPTILFSSIVYLPKNIFHGTSFSIEHFTYNILGGISFWFTSALAVAQIIIFTLLLSKQKNMWIYLIITAVIFFCGLFLNISDETIGIDNHFPWFYKTGMEYTFIMALGGIYWKYETIIDKKLNIFWLSLIGCVYIGILTLSFYGYNIKFLGLGGKITVLGFVEILCGITLITALCKHLPRIKALEFIGRNSILFYFFCGVFPAAVGALAHKFFPDTNYFITILVTIVALSLGWLTTKFIVRFLPFLTDFRKLIHQ